MSQTMIVMGAALGAEIVLLLIVALSVAYLRNRAARRRDHAAIQALIARVRKERPQREQAIARFLGSGLGYQDSDLSDSTTRLARAELLLLQRFATLYRERDADLAGRFDGELNGMLDAYHALAAAAAPAGDESVVPAADDAELEALRRENTRLSEELRITMETMSRMLNEYSTMFAPTTEPGELEPAAVAVDESPEPTAVSGLADDAVDGGGWAAVDDVPAQAETTAAEVLADAGDWEVAVDAPEERGAAVSADEAAAATAEPESQDPLAEIMRAAANQERSARGGVEAPAENAADRTAQAEPTGGEPGAVEDDVDLFDVVVESSASTAKADREPTAGVQADTGEDLFDVVEEPRSRSAS